MRLHVRLRTSSAQGACARGVHKGVCFADRNRGDDDVIDDVRDRIRMDGALTQNKLGSASDVNFEVNCVSDV